VPNRRIYVSFSLRLWCSIRSLCLFCKVLLHEFVIFVCIVIRFVPSLCECVEYSFRLYSFIQCVFVVAVT